MIVNPCILYAFIIGAVEQLNGDDCYRKMLHENNAFYDQNTTLTWVNLSCPNFHNN